MVIFCDRLLDELAAIADVMIVPYSSSSAPVFIPPEPDYPSLCSDPGPLDADV